jgi:hypothetical protein
MHRWEDNIKMDVKRTVGEGVDSIHQDQDRIQWLALVKTVMSLQVP